MKITKERLQEIKGEVEENARLADLALFQELITALEAAQIAADAAKLFMEKAEEERDEAQAEVERLRGDNEKSWDEEYSHDP